MESKWINLCLIVLVCAFVVNGEEVDRAHAAQLKQANVELANKTNVLMSDAEADIMEPSLAEQLYRMVFKREAKEEKKDEDSKTTTSAPVDTTTKSEEAKHEKPHHKSHHKKHKHHHKKHHKDNGTEVDWHSIG
ncbi:hypothetical protein M3Y97_01014500 [Aphelenchoides bicaudatus]|nr:hypothetical protein M3Y97_01014500 [Aphelenchoides bicaudatus]